MKTISQVINSINPVGMTPLGFKLPKKITKGKLIDVRLICVIDGMGQRVWF